MHRWSTLLPLCCWLALVGGARKPAANGGTISSLDGPRAFAQQSRPHAHHQCRRCATPIVRRDPTSPMKPRPFRSSQSLRESVRPLFGVPTRVHRLRNPAKIEFDLTIVEAGLLANYSTRGDRVEEYSWFEGYTWQVLVCAHCGAHIGWKFEATEATRRRDPEGARAPFFGILVAEAFKPGYDDHVHEAEQHLLMALRPLPLGRNKHGVLTAFVL